MEETTGKTVEQAGAEVELFEAEAADGRQHDPRSENAKTREKKKKTKAFMNDSHEEESSYERADGHSFKGSVSTENEEKMHAQDQLLHEEETTQRKRSNNSENEQHLAEESDDQEYLWSQSEAEGGEEEEEEEEEELHDDEENEDFKHNVDAEFQGEYTRHKRPDEDDANDESPPHVGIVALLPEGIHLPRTAYDAAWSRLMDKVAARSAEETMLTQLQHRSEDLEFSLETFRADVEAEIARHRARSSNYFKSNDLASVDGEACSIESKFTRTSSSSLGMSGRSSSMRTPLSVRRTPLASRRSRGADARLFTPLPGEQPAERPAGMVPALEMDRAMEGYLRAAQMARFRSRRLHAGGKPPIFG